MSPIGLGAIVLVAIHTLYELLFVGSDENW